MSLHRLENQEKKHLLRSETRVFVTLHLFGL